MNRDKWLQYVEGLTFKAYSTLEAELLELAMVGRVFDELRTPWNRYSASGALDASGRFLLPAELRDPFYVKIGTFEDVKQLSVDQVGQVKRGRLTGHTCGWWMDETSGGQPYLTPVPDQVEGTTVEVWYHGAPEAASVFVLSDRYPMLYVWAGCVEGFQLQGDEQGRERALRQFGIEVDRANAHADTAGWSGVAAR